MLVLDRKVLFPDINNRLIQMDKKNLPSSSDESDEDFVPREDEDSDTGSEVSNCENSEDENDSKTGISKKRKKRSSKKCKKVKTDISDDEEKETKNEEKESNIDIDALWADFKKDVNKVEAKKTAESSLTNLETQTKNVDKKTSESQQTHSSNDKPKSGLIFPTKSRGGGLSKVLNQIGKKDKMSTLQKSQLDWNKFKKSEGIEEEIKMYNKGKDGYLEKQDFLQRTDLRQFEIEKDLRSSRKKF